MRLESISVVLRPRTGWEAVDLGFRMAVRWAGPLWRVWFAVFLPVAAALLWAFQDIPWLAMLLVWWLKPLFDRYLLHVLSQAVFGQPPRLADTLRASRNILRPNMATALMSRFWDFRRSFNLPVTQLEQQTGRAGRQRRALLNQRAGGFAFGLTIVCLHFEAVVMLGLTGFGALFATDVQWQTELPSGPDWLIAANQYFSVLDAGLYFLALSLIEPFYVASGFALYLNRRITLEGWDLELAMKRMATTLTRTSVWFGAWIGAGVLVLGLSFAPLHVAHAQETETAAAEARAARAERVKSVVADPVFGGQRMVSDWVRKPDETAASPRRGRNPVLDSIGEVLRVLGWLAIAALVIGLIALVAGGQRSATGKANFEAPQSKLFGLDIDPNALPADVPSAAREALQQGNTRLALSLLYRGVLSFLVHRKRLKLAPGSTEAGVLQLARTEGQLGTADFLQRLLPFWVSTAYAARRVDHSAVLELCDDYPSALAESLPTTHADAQS